MNHFTIIQRFRNKIKVNGSGNKVILDNKRSLRIRNNTITIKGTGNTLYLKSNVNIKNSFLEIVGDNCSLTIGENVVIGDHCYLSVKDSNVKLKIGNDCMLSRNVKLMTSDGHKIYQNERIINNAKSINIQDKVWLADNVTILKGVDIGSNSIVGIDSVLTKSMPEHSIAAGNPAKVIKEGISWDH